MKPKQSGADLREAAHLKVGDNTLMTAAFATEEFLMNFNFHVVGGSILDPYITECLTSTVNLIVYAFNINDEVAALEAE